MDTNRESNRSEEDYYAFFNISKNATPEEITNAYRRLSKIYHPDKHRETAEREKDAETLYRRINKVYEVLSDPNKRAIYDNIGIRGLDSTNWDLALRTKNVQELLKAYEKLQIEGEEKKAISRGTFGVKVNATDLFNSYRTYYNGNDVFSSIEISGMMLTQSIETPLTPKNIAIVGGELSVKNGIGSGVINVGLKRFLTPMNWIETELSAGSWPALTFRGYKMLSNKIHLKSDIPLKFTSKGIAPVIVGTLLMEFNKSTVGYLTYKCGSYSSMTTTIIKSTKNSQITFTIEFSQLESFISLHYEHMLLEKKLGLLCFIQIGSSSWTMEYGVKKKISRNTTLSTVISVDSTMGVSLRLKLKRAYQIYKCSIFLSDDVTPAPVFYGTIVPLISWVLLKNFVLDPLLRQRKEQDKEQQRKEENRLWLEKKKEAKIAVELMQVTFSRIRATEEAKRGLVIVKAVYGKFIYPDERLRTNQNTIIQKNEIIDVTIPLQCLVQNSNLVLHKGSKSYLTGFYDPCIGEEKFLVVQYLFHMRTHECVIKDMEPLSIPKSSHLVNST